MPINKIGCPFRFPRGYHSERCEVRRDRSFLNAQLAFLQVKQAPLIRWMKGLQRPWRVLVFEARPPYIPSNFWQYAKNHSVFNGNRVF